MTTDEELVRATLALIEEHCAGELECFEQTPAANLPTCVEAVEALVRFLRSARKLVGLAAKSTREPAPAAVAGYATVSEGPAPGRVALAYNDAVEF